MLKVTHKVFMAGFMFFSLAGCTDNGFLFRSFGGYGSDEVGPSYVIGESYQIKDVWYTPKENYMYSEKGVASWYQEEPGKLTANGEKYDEEALTATSKVLPLPSLVRITNLENGNVAIVRVNERGPYVNNRLMDVSQKTAEVLEFNMTGTTMIQVDILPEESRKLKAEILRKHGGQMQEENVSGASVLSSDVQIEELSDQPKPIYQPDSSHEVVYGEKMSETASEISSVPASITTPPQEVKTISTTSQKELTPDSNQPVKTTQAAAANAADTTNQSVNQPALISPISGDYVQAGAFSSLENAHRLKDELERFGPVQIYDTQVNGVVLHRVRMGPFETRAGAEQLLDKLKQAGYVDSKIIYEP